MRSAWIAVLVAACGSSPLAPPTAPPMPPPPPPAVDPGARCGPATPPPTDAQPEGDIGADVISDGIQRRSEALKSCFVRLAADSVPLDHVRVTLAFVIAEDGSVTGITARGGPAALNACVCEQAIAIRYGGGFRANVSYPLMAFGN